MARDFPKAFRQAIRSTGPEAARKRKSVRDGREEPGRLSNSEPWEQTNPEGIREVESTERGSPRRLDQLSERGRPDIKEETS